MQTEKFERCFGKVREVADESMTGADGDKGNSKLNAELSAQNDIPAEGSVVSAKVSNSEGPIPVDIKQLGPPQKKKMNDIFGREDDEDRALLLGGKNSQMDGASKESK